MNSSQALAFQRHRLRWKPVAVDRCRTGAPPSSRRNTATPLRPIPIPHRIRSIASSRAGSSIPARSGRRIAHPSAPATPTASTAHRSLAKAPRKRARSATLLPWARVAGPNPRSRGQWTFHAWQPSTSCTAAATLRSKPGSARRTCVESVGAKSKSAAPMLNTSASGACP